MTPEEAFAELAQITGMSAREWRDFLSLPPDAQLAVAQAYRDQDWARAPDAMAEVLSVLSVVGAVAGAVSGVGGAVGAATALRALL